MRTTLPDQGVETISTALSGKTIDVIVSGSIGAVESARFLRALRRLGATVVPWLTTGGKQFTTETALSWAADHPVRGSFSGTESHVATADACVIAPASANFIRGMATGQTDSAPLAVAASHLGSGNTVMVLPNMHDSLAKAPAIARNLEALETLGRDGCHVLQAREEEGKQKFPPPEVLAGEVSHALNRRSKRTLLTMGTTRGYLDDVRYLSNYSSGALGSGIAEELYYRGYLTDVVCGPCEIRPRFSSALHKVSTTEEMAARVSELATTTTHAAIFAASVLDYQPAERESGKIRSGRDGMSISLVPTEKIIATAFSSSKHKVGFKLEPELSEERALEIAADYRKKYDLTHMVLNALGDVSPNRHKAFLVDCHKQSLVCSQGKRETAVALVELLMD